MLSIFQFKPIKNSYHHHHHYINNNRNIMNHKVNHCIDAKFSFFLSSTFLRLLFAATHMHMYKRMLPSHNMFHFTPSAFVCSPVCVCAALSQQQVPFRFPFQITKSSRKFNKNKFNSIPQAMRN